MYFAIKECPSIAIGLSSHPSALSIAMSFLSFLVCLFAFISPIIVFASPINPVEDDLFADSTIFNDQFTTESQDSPYSGNLMANLPNSQKLKSMINQPSSASLISGTFIGGGGWGPGGGGSYFPASTTRRSREREVSSRFGIRRCAAGAPSLSFSCPPVKKLPAGVLYGLLAGGSTGCRSVLKSFTGPKDSSAGRISLASPTTMMASWSSRRNFFASSWARAGVRARMRPV